MKVEFLASILAFVLFAIYFFLIRGNANNNITVFIGNDSTIYNDNIVLKTDIFSIRHYENNKQKYYIRFQKEIFLQKKIANENNNIPEHDTLQVDNDFYLYILEDTIPKSIMIRTKRKYKNAIKNHNNDDKLKPINSVNDIYTKFYEDGIYMNMSFRYQDESIYIDAILSPTEKTEENYKKLNIHFLLQNYKQLYSNQPTCNVIKDYNINIDSANVITKSPRIHIDSCALKVEDTEVIFSAKYSSYKQLK
jgi:hypothetical protein